MALARMLRAPFDDPDLDLYRRARADGQWKVSTAIDWAAPITLTPRLQEYTWRLASRHVYAEQTGLVIAAKLLEETEDVSIRLSLATAVSDEAKHSEIFAQYATKLGGSIDPPTAAAESFDERLRCLPTSEARFAVHTVLEALALDEFALLTKLFSDDPLARIYRLIRKDEARHVAIGFRYIQRQMQASEYWRENLAKFCDQGLDAAGCESPFITALGEQLGWGPGEISSWLRDRHHDRVSRLTTSAD